MQWHEVEPDVYYADGKTVLASAADLRRIEAKARSSPRGRARLCAHPDPADRLHEMLICLTQSCYIRPHRHFKPESALLLQGDCDLVLFDERGAISDVVPLKDRDGDTACFVRLSAPIYHTYVLRSDTVIFLETTLGPLDRSLTEYAAWAPAEGADGTFLLDLRNRLAQRRQVGGDSELSRPRDGT